VTVIDAMDATDALNAVYVVVAVVEILEYHGASFNSVARSGRLSHAYSPTDTIWQVPSLCSRPSL
jgi:hypothetical protein